MIELSRLNGSHMVVNSDLIKYAEASPDTMLTMVSGEKLVVLESCVEVVARVTAYRARLFAEAARHFPAGSPGALVFSSALRALTAEKTAHQASEPPGMITETAQRRRLNEY